MNFSLTAIAGNVHSITIQYGLSEAFFIGHTVLIIDSCIADFIGGGYLSKAKTVIAIEGGEEAKSVKLLHSLLQQHRESLRKAQRLNASFKLM